MKNQSKFYDQLNVAFEFYNQELFSETPLVTPIFSIRARANSAGYFAPERLHPSQVKKTKGKTKKPEAVHEIAFNPVILNRPINHILSTLVHEMAHLWQEQYGKPSRNGYHNKEWANKMVLLGLIPSATGAPGGKMTGGRMTHYIEKDGAFEMVTKKLLKNNKFDFFYEVLPEKKKAPNSKVKFTCPLCGQNAWGKPELSIECAPCRAKMESED